MKEGNDTGRTAMDLKVLEAMTSTAGADSMKIGEGDKEEEGVGRKGISDASIYADPGVQGAPHMASSMMGALERRESMDAGENRKTGSPCKSTPRGLLIEGETKANCHLLYSVGLRQVALQSLVLILSWGVLASLQPAASSLLLLIAIALSRLHFGWLLCCVFHLLLTSGRREPSRSLNTTERILPFKVFRGLRKRCWSHLPLRYWHCVFYLFLLLISFWAASIVQEDSQEGLHALQGGGGSTSGSIATTWRGGSLPPLLLNSETPQHIKIAAKAVAGGREASDQMLWLLHSATRQQYKRFILWVRHTFSWLDRAFLQPLISLLSHIGLMASANGTCNVSDAPHVAAADDSEAYWWWVAWARSAVQTAVRTLPSVAHSFLCGDGSEGRSGSTSDEAPGWQEKEFEDQFHLGPERTAVEVGQYCLALCLMLVYFLSIMVHKVCLAIPASLKELLVALGLELNSASASTGGWWEGFLVIFCRSAATSFSVTFVALLLLYLTVAAASRSIALVTSLLTSRSSWSSSSSNSATDISSNNAGCSAADKTRGTTGLEIFAACLTCWILLLPDRKFVMFTWVTMQPLRLSVLSAVLLLQLPSAQVAALLSWPPPLREPALMLQRSQPLRIIDPVALGAMFGCIFAAGLLSVVWCWLARNHIFSSNPSTPANVPAIDYSLGPLGCTRGLWATRTGQCNGANSVWQRVQEQRQVILELRKLLKEEQNKASLDKALITKLKAEAQARSASESPRVNKQQDVRGRTQGLALHLEPGSEGAVCGQSQGIDTYVRLHAEQGQRMESHGAEERNLAVHDHIHDAVEREIILRRKVDDLQCQLLEAQSQLVDFRQQQDSEREELLQRQSQLEGYVRVWKEKQMETAIQRDQLQLDLEVAAKKLASLTASRDGMGEQLREARDRCNHMEEQTQRMVHVLQKQAEDLVGKTAEINELRKRLTEASREAKRLRDFQTQKTHQEAAHEQQLTSPQNHVDILDSVRNCTRTLEANLLRHAQTLQSRKMQLSQLGSGVSPLLPNATGAGVGFGTSEDTERQQHEGSSGSSSEDQPLLEEPSCADNAVPEERSAAAQRRDRKEALSKEDSNRMAEAMHRIDNCIFPLLQVLRGLELPQATLDAARQLYNANATATGHGTSAAALLQHAFSRPSRCSWKGDVEALAFVLTVLLGAWPTEESSKRLVQREGEANALTPMEQKFLPFAKLPEGRQRVATVLFLLKLDSQWQEEIRRLDRLEQGLVNIMRSELLRRFYRTCCEIHCDMCLASSSEAFWCKEQSFPESGDKLEEIMQTRPLTSSIWGTKEELDAALTSFKVWEDNSEFNMGCLKAAASIRPSGLKGYSLLHVILSRMQFACGSGRPSSTNELHDNEAQVHTASSLDLPQLLERDIYGHSASTELRAKESACTPLPFKASTRVHECRCALCVDHVHHSTLREWRRQRTAMKVQQIFGTPSKKSLSSSRIANPSELRNEEANDQMDDDNSTLMRLEEAIAIAGLYVDVLSNRQDKVAELARRIRREVTVEALQIQRYRGRPLESFHSKEDVHSSPEKEFHSEVISLKAVAPPAAEAATSPGCIQTETERGLEMAFLLLKTVHATVFHIEESWHSFSNTDISGVEAVPLDSSHMGPMERQAMAASGPLTGHSLKPSLADLATSAAVAAKAAVMAKRALRSTSKGESTKTSAPHRHETTSEAGSCSTTSIPRPTLLASQTSSIEPFQVGRNLQQITRLASNKSTKRSRMAGGASISTSPPSGRKEPLTRRYQSNGTMGPPVKWEPVATMAGAQQRGRIARNLHQAGAPSSRFPRQTAHQKKDDSVPVKEFAVLQPAVATGQQRGAGGQRRIRHPSTSDGSGLFLKPESSDSSSGAQGNPASPEEPPRLSDAKSAVTPSGDAGESIPSLSSQTSRLASAEGIPVKEVQEDGKVGNSSYVSPLPPNSEGQHPATDPSGAWK